MIAYALFDAWSAGIVSPWTPDQTDVRILCAGDDCLRLTRPELTNHFVQVIKGHAANGSRELDNGGQAQGLG